MKLKTREARMNIDDELSKMRAHEYALRVALKLMINRIDPMGCESELMTMYQRLNQAEAILQILNDKLIDIEELRSTVIGDK